MIQYAHINRRGRATVVTIIDLNELNIFNVPKVKEALLSVADERPEILVVDLANIDYVDSSGLGLLVQTKLHIDSQGGTYLLAGINDTIKNLFRMTRLDQKFKVYDTADDALRETMS